MKEKRKEKKIHLLPQTIGKLSDHLIAFKRLFLMVATELLAENLAQLHALRTLITTTFVSLSKKLHTS